jgi:hypothetical protein
MTDDPSSNSLGLDFDRLKLSTSAPVSEALLSNDSDNICNKNIIGAAYSEESELLKKKPYVNPERVKTGGTHRASISEKQCSLHADDGYSVERIN